MRDNPRVSVAVPLYNEEGNVAELLRRIGAVLDALPGGPHEMVFVDDGSSDATRRILEEAASRDSRVVVVSLSRNFGHQAAFSAAMDHTNGDVAILMDGDLQDPPEVIPKFIEAYREGNDVVYAQRINRKESWWLRGCYFLFYRLLSRMSHVSLPVDAGDFGLMSRRVVDELRRAGEYHRYLRGLRTWVGFQQIGIPVERDPRYAGVAKYNLTRLFGLAFDGIFSFSVVPLRLAAALGVLTILASAAFGAYSVYVALVLGGSPRGFTALALIVMFLSGVILISLGIIGEYLGRVYEQTKARPIYIVDEVVRGRPAKPAEPPTGAHS